MGDRWHHVATSVLVKCTLQRHIGDGYVKSSERSSRFQLVLDAPCLAARCHRVLGYVIVSSLIKFSGFSYFRKIIATGNVLRRGISYLYLVYDARQDVI